MKKYFLIFLVIFVIFSEVASAQSSLANTKRNVGTIIFAGLGGAVLGISTLSFYGKPQEHVSNISTGFALGIIAGTVYVSMNALSPTTAVTPPKQNPRYDDDISFSPPSNPNQRLGADPSYFPIIGYRFEM